MEDLRHVQRDEVFGELSEVLADAVERSVLAVPDRTLALAIVYVCVWFHGHSLQDDVETLGAPHEAVVLDDIRMIQVLEQVNLHLHVLEVCGAQVLEADLLDGDCLARAPVECPVHAAECAFAQAVAQLEVLEARDILGCLLRCPFSARPLFALAGLAVVVGRGRRLLGVAAGCVGRGRGLRRARVGGRMRWAGGV